MEANVVATSPLPSPFLFKIMAYGRLPGYTPPYIPTYDNGQNQMAAEEGLSKSTLIKIHDEKNRFHQTRSIGFARKGWAVATWTPQRCRWNQDDPL